MLFLILPIPPTEFEQVKTSDEFHCVCVQTERTDSESRVGKSNWSAGSFSNLGDEFGYCADIQSTWPARLYGRSRATQSQMKVRIVRPMVAWRRFIPCGSEGSGRFIAATYQRRLHRVQVTVKIEDSDERGFVTIVYGSILKSCRIILQRVHPETLTSAAAAKLLWIAYAWVWNQGD